MDTGSLLLRSAALGTASGLRSQMGLAALALLRPATGRAGTPVARGAIGLAAAGELVADKLPMTPSRTAPGPLFGRLVCGAMAAGTLARRASGPLLPAVAVGAVTAVLGAKLSHDARAHMAERVGADLPVALGEDALAAGLALVAARD